MSVMVGIRALAALSLALGNGCEPRGSADASGDAPAAAERATVHEPVPMPPPAENGAHPAAISSDSTPARPGVPEAAREPAGDGALDVPVAGVARAQLRDTYADPRGERVHEALDIPAPRGTPVLSAADGRLLKLFDSKPGGLMVYATDASERFILLYGHLDAWAEGLREGMALARGQVIGYVGTTGNAPPDTPHLHFGILRGDPHVSWWEGEPVNPYPLLVRGRLPD